MQQQQLIDAFKQQGVNITLIDLEAAQDLLTSYEVEANNIAIARVALLKYQNPTWSDARVVEEHLKLQKERASQQSGYGDEVVSGLEDEIWSALEQSGAFETVAENIRAKGLDRVMELLKNGGNSERMDKRFSALGNANNRYQQRSAKEDDVIDVPYIEGSDDINAVISHALNAVNPSRPKLLSAGEKFSTVNPVEKPEGNGNGKKLLSSGRRGKRN